MKLNAKKILIFRLGALGDIVHTTVIARSLKKAYPDCEIVYCVESRYREIIENTEYIDRIITYDQTLRKSFSYNLKFAFSLREERFDIVFNLTNVLRNNLISLVANPSKIIFYKKDKNLHVVESFYNTASYVIEGLSLPENLSIGTDEAAFETVRSSLSEYPRPYYIFSPGGQTDKSRQGRIWNKDSWVVLGNELLEKFGGTVFITGTGNEKIYHKEISSNIQSSVLLTGELTLKEIKCLFKLSDLFISGDTGPLHVASALGVNAIGIFGSTDVKNVMPYGDKGFYVSPNKDVCRFCWKKKCKFLKKGQTYTPCMESIKPDKVIKLIEDNKLINY